MVVHNERRKGTWGTPLALLIIASAFGIFGWGLSDLLTQVRISITELKTESDTHFDKLWTAFSTTQTKVNCLENQLTKCCQNASYCG